MERSSYEMYQIEVTETTPVEGGTVTRHYPTFYLHPDVQGIVNAEDAAKIALRARFAATQAWSTGASAG